MGTLRVELGKRESLNERTDTAATAAARGNATTITPFYAAFCKEQVLVVTLVLIILFAAILSHCLMSVPMTLFRLFTFTHHL